LPPAQVVIHTPSWWHIGCIMGRPVRRLRVLLLFAFTGCAHTVTEPNPPSPPAKLDVPYAGRIVLSTPELRDRVDSFASPWIRRLEILGLTAQITYDDDRAVFDVYGTD